MVLYSFLFDLSKCLLEYDLPKIRPNLRKPTISEIERNKSFYYYRGSPLSTIFLDLEIILQCKIRAIWVVHEVNSTSRNLLIRSPTSTTLWTTFWKFVLVEIVLVETPSTSCSSNPKTISGKKNPEWLIWSLVETIDFENQILVIFVPTYYRQHRLNQKSALWDQFFLSKSTLGC